MKRRATSDRVSWLELFYDLVVIASVGRGSEIFSASPTWGTGAIIGVSVIVLFVVWLLTTLNHGLFPGDHPARAALILVQMLALTVAALSIGESGLPTDVGLISLGIAFASICGMWILTRAWEPAGSALSGPVIAGSGLGAVLLVVAGLQPDDGTLARIIMALGIAVAGLPVVTVFIGRAARLNALDGHHLQERLSLFVLIMLGESFVHLASDLAGKASIPSPLFLVLTFLVVFAIWVLYRASTQGRDLPASASALRWWLVAHLVLAFGAVSVSTSFAELTLTPVELSGASDHTPWTALPLAYVIVAMLMLGAVARVPRPVMVTHAVALAGLLILVLLDLLGIVEASNVLVAIGAVFVMADAVVVTAWHRDAPSTRATSPTA